MATMMKSRVAESRRKDAMMFISGLRQVLMAEEGSWIFRSRGQVRVGDDVLSEGAGIKFKDGDGDVVHV